MGKEDVLVLGQRSSTPTPNPDAATFDFFGKTDDEVYALFSDGTEKLVTNQAGIETFTQQTTDATVTTVGTVDIAETEAWLVKVSVIANIADYSAALGVEQYGIFRRATAGNVTLVGALQGTVQEDSGAAPTFALAADTGTQTVDVNVTGVAAETWDWTIKLTKIQRT